MASFLRQLVAGPRTRHPEAGLDLCYVTDHIVATSGPSQTYPQLAYRNPLDQLVAFLDSKHGKDWAIWEFRAEGTGYPDDAVYGRIRHYPWPDHHPPPFRLMPIIMASMRNWLHGGELEGGGTTSAEKHKDRVVVVHCKAGKGRSGTSACSYLISEEGWSAKDALARFTERRMRPKFGSGVSIPSQVRWIGYVERWARNGKKYRDRSIEIVEIHVWGLRNGVKVDVEGFADEGKRIETLHTFKKEERIVVQGDAPEGGGLSELVWDFAGYTAKPKSQLPEDDSGIAEDTNPDKVPERTASAPPEESKPSKLKRKGTNLINKVTATGSHQNVDKLRSKTMADSSASSTTSSSGVSTEPPENPEPGGMAVILRPAKPVTIPNGDVNISMERRNNSSKSLGMTMVSAVAHVWFNTFFEGQGPEQGGQSDDSGVFTIDWEAMDGIKGSSRKGARALDRIAVVWRVANGDKTIVEEEITEPEEGQPVPQVEAADWKGVKTANPGAEKNLGLRVQSPLSADVSRASSVRSGELKDVGKHDGADDAASLEGVRSSGPEGEELVHEEGAKTDSPVDGETKTGTEESTKES